MTQEDALNLIHPRLYSLLCLMFSRFASWRPRIGYSASSVGFSCGWTVSDFEDLENEVDTAAVRALEAGYDELTMAERTMIEQVIGFQPWVWSARPGVMESAIGKLEKKLRIIGAI